MLFQALARSVIISSNKNKKIGSRNIRVNAINPGILQTEGAESSGIIESDLCKKVRARTPLGRIGQPQDITKAALFFASDDSVWITSETLVITDGFH